MEKKIIKKIVSWMMSMLIIGLMLAGCGRQKTVLSKTGETPEWIARLGEEKGAGQIFVVAGMGKTTAYVSLHEKDASGNWKEIMTTPGYIGKFGLGKTKEGDGKTPVGEFRFNYAFGIADDPGCSIKYHKVTDDDYWSGDVRDGYGYNTMVSLKDYPDLAVDNSERIKDYELQYQYCLNISYNEDGTPGAGSAIFLHCLGPVKPYTGGCVAIPADCMETVMQNVREDCVVVIDSLEVLSPETWEEYGLAGVPGFGTQDASGNGSSASHEFDFDGNEVSVTVDLSDGWTVEFGKNATYLYSVDSQDEAIANGVYVDKDQYGEMIREYSSYDSYEEVADGIKFQESEDLAKYVIDLGGGVYYMIMTHDTKQAEEIYARFKVEMIE